MSVSLVEERIQKELSPVYLRVENIGECESAKIAVHVVSESFQGQPRLARHRLLNDLFKSELLDGQIHALTVKTQTPEEFKKAGGTLE